MEAIPIRRLGDRPDGFGCWTSKGVGRRRMRWFQNFFVAKFQFFRRDKEGEQKDLRRSRTAVKAFLRNLSEVTAEKVKLQQK